MSSDLDEKFESTIAKLLDNAKAAPLAINSVQFAQAAMYVANAKASYTTGVATKKLSDK